VPSKILTEKQELLISHLPDEIRTNYYLAGGTALSAFYLGHRRSEDMDFFTDAEEKMAPIEFLTGIIKGLPSLDQIHFERLFDRRIFVASFKDSQIEGFNVLNINGAFAQRQPFLMVFCCLMQTQ